ncbi:RtcB family protein [Virgibacillus sp. W0430]|uniref:RtcB family protein n=1 Tax=Virgibacillus sp. W0430 TaxID=3391580 RepID=UPI003F487E39
MHRIVFGKHEDRTLKQFDTCLKFGRTIGGALCADGHYGYSQPVGAVIAYDNQISPSGVGYDIACGNKAVQTDIKYDEIKHAIRKIMDDIQREIPFGFGKNSNEISDHELFDDPNWHALKTISVKVYDQLKSLARKQLGTVGSGNHYVDILIDEQTTNIWAANHFGSRGFGHRIATGFINLAMNRDFLAKSTQPMGDQSPVLLDFDRELGQLYFKAMTLAGRYAYAGRDIVMDKTLKILGASALTEVHNHHNYAWIEKHFGKEYVVIRKGATPAFPGQLGFVGGSMADTAVILQGIDTNKSKKAFYSTIHGAGRIMSRTQAAGKMNWKKRKRTGGIIEPEQMKEAVNNYGVELRGGGTDESPFVYRKLRDVLAAHQGTVEVLHTLKPIGVCMASD